MRFVIAGIAGGFSTLISGTVIAIIMQPWIAPLLGEQIRKEGEDGLLFPALVAGYLIVGFCLSFLAPRLNVKSMKLSEILMLGTVLGLAVFLGDHLITAGWSRLNAVAMILSGLSDSLSITVGFLVVALVHRYKASN